MKPGLARAVPMGILGFLLGVLIVFILRGLQSLDPIWDPQIGLILAAFTSSFAFVWGMGAYNPSVNQHPHEPEIDEETGLIVVDASHDEEHDHHDEEPEEGFSVFGWSLWQVSFLTIVLLFVIGAAATLPTGFYLQQSNDPGASPASVGTTTMTLPFGGPEIEVTQLTLFIGLVLITIVSLGAIGGVLALIFYSLSGNVKAANEAPDVPFGMQPQIVDTTAPALPAGEGETAEEDSAIEAVPQRQNPLLQNLILAVRFVVVAAILYVLFYYVFIGLVLPNAPVTLTVLSIVNAVLFAAVILHTTFVLRLLGKGAAGLAQWLRGLPEFLGQK